MNFQRWDQFFRHGLLAVAALGFGTNAGISAYELSETRHDVEQNIQQSVQLRELQREISDLRVEVGRPHSVVHADHNPLEGFSRMCVCVSKKHSARQQIMLCPTEHEICGEEARKTCNATLGADFAC